MGLCIGGKACRRQKCKERCRAWFGAQPDIEYACKNACSDDHDFNKDDFLCSGNWLDQQVMMGSYGYDPCLSSGPGMEDFIDPLDDREREESKRESYKPIIIGGLLILMVALFVLFAIIKK